MGKIDSLRDAWNQLKTFTIKFFGFKDSKSQREATDTALTWAFVVGLVAGLAFVPYPLNIFVLVVVVFWFIGYQRHNFEIVNKIWKFITLERYRKKYIHD